MRNYLSGSKASGGGASGSSGTGSDKPFKDWSLTDKAKLANSDPEKYKLLSKG